MTNYKLVATQFGEAIKYESIINKIDRTFLSLTNLTFEQYPNPAITSSRSQNVYSWVMTISESSLNGAKKNSLIREAIEMLVSNDKDRLKLLRLLPRKSIAKKKTSTKSGSWNYINKTRLLELKRLCSDTFDFSKSVKLCEELNLAFSNSSYLSVTMLTRAILDHIPRVFGFENFTQVANNYGQKSFKDSMSNLNNSSRKIADAHLHAPIRRRESLPNLTQIDFSNDLDILLSEIIRVYS